MLFAATKTAIALAFAAALHSKTAPDPAETLSEARLKISAAMRTHPLPRAANGLRAKTSAYHQRDSSGKFLACRLIGSRLRYFHG
jgi:hypothetical protein